MKKQTFNLVIRALIGVAASLLIVGAMGLINESQNNQTLLEQASGVKADAVAMTVSGEDVSAEEYLYMAAYQAQSLAAYGIVDLNTELGEGMTAADYVASQAEAQVVASAVLRGWAKEMGVTMTEEDLAALQAQKDAYGDAAAFVQTLQLVGTSEKLFDDLMSQSALYNHLYEIYCGENGAQRPTDDALKALAQEHNLASAYVLTAAADAEIDMADYAARVAAAENKVEMVAALAAELQCDGNVQTFDCCHSTPVNDALMALSEGEVSAVVEDAGVQYVLLRAELDLDTVAYVHFEEEYSRRVSEAVVEYNAKVMEKIDVAAFYTKYGQLQQSLYNSLMQ
ncbi:MAG: hypothetical protein IKV99_02895 [Oscillospiraceae bacterium]|nr:hypothetical protein [Oscillospiraceae bacterium]